MFYFITQKFILPSCLLLPRIWILNTHTHTPQIQTQHSVGVMIILFQTWEVYFHFLFKYLFYVHMYDLGVCVFTKCLQNPQGTEEGIRYPWN